MGDETGRVVLWAGDVARMFGVQPRMVNRWAVADPPKLPHFRTPGGRLRFYLDEIQPIRDAGTVTLNHDGNTEN